ncbi:alpha/beta fold hydrolase [Mycobacterium sp. NPDC051198]
MANPVAGSAQCDGLRVATVGPLDAQRDVLVFMGLHACIDSFELDRYAVLAREWDAQVTVVDTPGCGHGGATLSRAERTGLRHGNFTAVARRMVGAVVQVEPRLRRRQVTMLGYSLGTSIAAAAAAAPGLIQVQRLVAIEPVAMRIRNPLRLMRMARAEDAFVPHYRMRNPESDTGCPPDSPASRGDLARLGYALSRGTLTRDLLRAGRFQRFGLQVVHGRDSLLSPAGDIERLATACRRSGMPVRDITVDGRHALWQSLPDVAAIARETRTQWTY